MGRALRGGEAGGHGVFGRVALGGDRKGGGQNGKERDHGEIEVTFS
jgi:hypothetical protein